VRRGAYVEGISMLGAAEADLRRLGIDAYADFAHVLIVEAEAFGGDPLRALEIASQALQANDRERPLLTRMGGIALARLGQRAVALRELRHSLQTARARNAEYDIAATIDVMASVEDVEPDLLRERDAILSRLRIEHLPAPALTTNV
jgi:hypothetical protein